LIAAEPFTQSITIKKKAPKKTPSKKPKKKKKGA
jgi:hypothetical protein